MSDTYIEQRWISEWYTKWKDAACGGRGFKGHELLKGHKEAIQHTVILTIRTVDVGQTLLSKYSDEKCFNC